MPGLFTFIFCYLYIFLSVYSPQCGGQVSFDALSRRIDSEQSSEELGFLTLYNGLND